ncbi:MAG: hypothetical protein KIT22_15795 [Verrucomicrobiae bacterium]|nr:hypothetical protein [Verrucomicrobiae bacterium]
MQRRIRGSPLLLLLAFCAAVHLRAQVDVDLVMDREIFLPGEPIEVAVRFANFSGGPIELGAQPDWLQFAVERVGGPAVNKLQETPESGTFTLEQATRGKLRWNLTPLFSLEDPGSYRVFATVHLPDNEVQSTAPIPFDIVMGAPLHEPREVGVKLPDGSIDRRKYVLQQVNFLKRLQLYLRITDPSESRTHAIIPMGSTVTFDRPQWVVDRETRFHVLHRTAQGIFAYHVFRGDGALLVRQLWTGDPRPELQIVNESGEIIVRKGQRRPDPSDIPSVAATNAVSSVTAPGGGTTASGTQDKPNDPPTQRP